MPKSKVRKKAVYTPPPRSTKAKVSPSWLVPSHARVPARRPGLDRHVLHQRPEPAGLSAAPVEPGRRIRADRRRRDARDQVAVTPEHDEGGDHLTVIAPFA